MSGKILVLGADEQLRKALELLIPGIRVHVADGAVDTEGIDVDVVVIAGDHPLEELTEVRVHPRLFATPVVLVAPGHRMAEDEWRARDVWPVTSQGFDVIEDLTEQVAWLLSRAHHPGRRRAAELVAGAHAAS